MKEQLEAQYNLIIDLTAQVQNNKEWQIDLEQRITSIERRLEECFDLLQLEIKKRRVNMT